MDRQEKRLTKLSKQLERIDRTLSRIEILVVALYEHRFSEPPQHPRPPP